MQPLQRAGSCERGQDAEEHRALLGWCCAASGVRSLAVGDHLARGSADACTECAQFPMHSRAQSMRCVRCVRCAPRLALLSARFERLLALMRIKLGDRKSVV